MTLKELRKNARLTQEQVAKLLEVDQASVSFWENGKFVPARKHQRKLAKLYGCTVEELPRKEAPNETPHHDTD